MDYCSIDETKYTPMMRQYLKIKKDYMDAIVFFRLGDFYEMFFDDALKASRELEIALTGRDAGTDERVPMCGIPYHAYSLYVEKLINKGYKVAIVEQITDPKDSKGIVMRDVVKIITPGTIIESGLNDKENNFIASFIVLNKQFILAYCDVSTGEIYLTIFNSIDILVNEIINLNVREIVVDNTFNKDYLKNLTTNYQIIINQIENIEIKEYLNYLKTDEILPYFDAVSLLLNYILGNQRIDLKHFKNVKLYNNADYLLIDPFSKKNLELLENYRQKQRSGSLLWLLDKCQTAMGSRLLISWINRPLINIDKIKERQSYVEAFNNQFIIKEEIKNALKSVYDLERIIGRISSLNANAKDLLQLKRSLEGLPKIKELLKDLNIDKSLSFGNKIDLHRDLYNLLEKSLLDNPPLSIKEGQMIKEGFNKELDEIKNISNNSKDFLLEYELKEKERLQIKNLKIGYNRVFGYFIEITKAQLQTIDESLIQNYERKQTVAAKERFITEELKKYEQIILGSHDKIIKIEYDLFCEIRKYASTFIRSLQELAHILATIDVLISFSEVSMKNNYVKPVFNDEKIVSVIDARHPVLEVVLTETYVSNDIILDSKYNMQIITGPNMSGKSTYMKMFALIIIMAQIGSYVPASSCNIMIFDQIFTRIGASDDLLTSQSTFMVEMNEANFAISNATKNSLILFDEIGRGTATFDGMALAWSIIEYIHEKIGAFTLFSTHYHELVGLEKTLKRVKNVHVAAKETKQGVLFLHKVLDGPTDKSYGINVAMLAKLPKKIIERSLYLLEEFEKNSMNKQELPFTLFDFSQEEKEVEEETNTLLEEIKMININSLTPLEAINILHQIQKKANEEK